MDPMNDRIAIAWSGCKSWVQDIDGTPIITLILDFPLEGINQSITQLISPVINLKTTVIKTDDPGTLSYIPTEEIERALEMFTSKSLAEISFDLLHDLNDLLLDLHFRLYWVDKDKALIELNWWNDQLFPDDTDDPQANFSCLAKYLLSLQSLFSAKELHIGKESSLLAPASDVEFIKV